VLESLGTITIAEDEASCSLSQFNAQLSDSANTFSFKGQPADKQGVLHHLQALATATASSPHTADVDQEGSPVELSKAGTTQKPSSNAASKVVKGKNSKRPSIE